MARSCSVLVHSSVRLAPLTDRYLSGLLEVLLVASSVLSPQFTRGLSARIRPGGGRLGGVEGLGFLRESRDGVSTREAGFHSVVGGAGGGTLGEMRGGGAPRHGDASLLPRF